MIVYTHHSFFDKPPHPPKPKQSKPKPTKPKLPKVKVCKPRDIEAERARRRAYYQNHKDEIKLRRLKKSLSDKKV